LKHSLQNRKAVTLAEMIIAMAISVSLLAVVVLTYTTVTRVFQQELARTEIWFEGNKSLMQMTKEIRGSRKVVSAEAQRLTIWPQDLNLNYSIEASELISYSVTGGNLTRTSSTDSMILTSQVININYNYDKPSDPSLVIIKLTLGSGASLSTFESKVRLRNK